MRKVFGGILLAIGILVAGVSGLCSALFLWPGTPGPNKYGPDPLNRVANRPAA